MFGYTEIKRLLKSITSRITIKESKNNNLKIMNPELEFSTTVNFSESDKRYQAIYVTQVYGTLFILYARFHIRKNGDNMKINKIELLGVNYKGPVSLRVDSTRFEVDDDEKRLSLTLVLQGNGTGTFSKPDPIEPDVEIPEGYMFVVHRELKKMNPSLDLPGGAFWKGQFDSEFYVRDGFMIDDIDSLHEFSRENIQDPESEGMLQPGSEPGAYGKNCPIGFAMIKFS